MNDVTLYCLTTECHWSGHPDELVAVDTDPDNFAHCPRCEGTDFHEEEHEEVDE